MRVKNTLKTGILNIVFQIAFLIVMYLVGSTRSAWDGEISKAIILFLLVLVPSIIWTVFFYLQDRLNPEPLPHVTASYLAGMATAALAAVPLTHTVFRLRSWLYADTTLFILGSFLITAAVFSILIYLILRYGFYSQREFDEPVDGMIYGAIAGAGYAFVTSFHQLALHPNYTLFVIAYIAATNILIYSAVGSVIGYVMGTAKFKRKNIEWFSLIGIILGIILLGIYHLVNEFIFISGFEHAFWLSFILSILYALSILLFCYIKMRKLTQKDVHQHIPVWSKFDPWVTGFIAIVLLAALLVSHQGLKGNKYENKTYGISFYYPHSLSPLSFNRFPQSLMPVSNEARILFLAESDTSPCYSFFLLVYPKDPQHPQPELMQFVEVGETESLVVSETQIGDKIAKRLAYSFLDREWAMESEKGDGFPRLIHVYTDVIRTDQTIFVLTFKAPSGDLKPGLRQHRKILKSIRWNGLKEE